MGNRAVITTPEKDLALCLHWNGGRDTVEPLLKYCELQGYRPPSTDTYGWARMAQVVGNFFGGSMSLGIDRFDRLGDQGDNGGREDLSRSSASSYRSFANLTLKSLQPSHANRMEDTPANAPKIKQAAGPPTALAA